MYLIAPDISDILSPYILSLGVIFLLTKGISVHLLNNFFFHNCANLQLGNGCSVSRIVLIFPSKRTLFTGQEMIIFVIWSVWSLGCPNVGCFLLGMMIKLHVFEALPYTRATV